MTYSSDELPSGLDPASTDILGTDGVVGDQGGGAVRFSLDTLKDFVLSDIGNSSDSALRRLPQAANAKRALMADGTFRNPLLVGAGTLTVGSDSDVTNNSAYNAWPVVCRLFDGRIMTAYATGASHHGDNTGKAVGKISDDEGATWGAQFDIYDHASLWTSPLGVTQVASGRIFVTLFRDNFSVSGSGEAGLVYSDDQGATWSTWVDLDTPSGFTQESYAAGPVVELPNGDLVVNLEGSNSGDPVANRGAKLLRSTNGGTTWGSVVTIRAYATDSRPYYESHMGLLADNSLFIIHRTSDAAGTHYTQRSTDYGATWSAPASAFSGHGKPNWILSSTGTLICTTRKNSDDSVIAFTSIDSGATWSAGTAVAAVDMMYAAPVELLDGRVLVIYGAENSSSDSDIVQVAMTEATSTIQGVSDGDKGDITVSGSGATWSLDDGVGKPIHCIAIACSDETTALTTGTAKVTFRMPYAFTLTEIPRASVTTAPTGTGNLTVDINEAGSSILSTKLTFDASEKTTKTAATPAVLSDSSLADDAEMTVDIDAVSGTITGAGLKVYLIGRRT